MKNKKENRRKRIKRGGKKNKESEGGSFQEKEKVEREIKFKRLKNFSLRSTHVWQWHVGEIYELSIGRICCKRINISSLQNLNIMHSLLILHKTKIKVGNHLQEEKCRTNVI